jgi:hypothetical protein
MVLLQNGASVDPLNLVCRENKMGFLSSCRKGTALSTRRVKRVMKGLLLCSWIMGPLFAEIMFGSSFHFTSSSALVGAISRWSCEEWPPSVGFSFLGQKYGYRIPRSSRNHTLSYSLFPKLLIYHCKCRWATLSCSLLAEVKHLSCHFSLPEVHRSTLGMRYSHGV